MADVDIQKSREKRTQYQPTVENSCVPSKIRSVWDEIRLYKASKSYPKDYRANQGLEIMFSSTGNNCM